MHPPVHVAAAENDQPSFLVFITRGLAREPITQSLSCFLAMAEAQMPQSAAPHESHFAMVDAPRHSHH
jgi:hypothetical protein